MFVCLWCRFTCICVLGGASTNIFAAENDRIPDDIVVLHNLRYREGAVSICQYLVIFGESAIARNAGNEFCLGNYWCYVSSVTHRRSLEGDFSPSPTQR
jgi:hypothetical protein